MSSRRPQFRHGLYSTSCGRDGCDRKSSLDEWSNGNTRDRGGLDWSRQEGSL